MQKCEQQLIYNVFGYLDMRENEDFVFVINWVRGLINSVEAESDVAAYPNGYPFTFWQQYISLRFWLFISLACVILAVFLVLSLILLNPWAAAIMVRYIANICHICAQSVELLKIEYQALSIYSN